MFNKLTNQKPLLMMLNAGALTNQSPQRGRERERGWGGGGGTENAHFQLKKKSNIQKHKINCDFLENILMMSASRALHLNSQSFNLSAVFMFCHVPHLSIYKINNFPLFCMSCQTCQALGASKQMPEGVAKKNAETSLQIVD